MNADRLAPWYRLVEYCAFGKALERRRFAYLDRLSGAQRILIPGEGDGRVLRRVRKIAPDAWIDVVEMSGAMVGLARAETSAKVRFRQEDARMAVFDAGSYDAVVTCFFLDCFSEKEARVLVQRLARALKPGGTWLMSDFAVPERGWRQWHARVWIRVMYTFFSIATGLRTQQLPPIAALLQEAGLTRVAHEEERAGLIVSEVWRLDG